MAVAKHLALLCLLLAVGIEARRKLKRHSDDSADSAVSLRSDEDFDEDYGELEPCQCGVFMSMQVGIKEGRRRPRGPPTGEPVVTYDTDSPSLPCGSGGFKHCISKCLDVILKYLPRAGPVICGAVERDVDREKAFLFIRNCGGAWTPTNFSAGKEFCCKDGQHEKC
ncbi:follicle cell protein 3C-1 [Aricia agestis]|uniref:follicle cell protein 3C-1 n=1 Tax=Aricia agestis TaxID=91739 RepID=UPI001C206586|nr:follicle cell protein 3C-1 [Aricia agestis]XP_041974130.1 follicle cell protein 3C-1 [Aricia agestis]XP_041974131.1 follicle cell protein 3C-1 [Aricia agestis]